MKEAFRHYCHWQVFSTGLFVLLVISCYSRVGQQQRERRGDVMANHSHSGRGRGGASRRRGAWPAGGAGRGEEPLIHRCHGFVAGGGSDCEENKDFCSVADGRSRFPQPDVGTAGLGLPLCPHGRSWHPGYTLFFFNR